MSEIVQPRRFCGVLCISRSTCTYRRETARQLRMYAELTRCFSAVAELLVSYTRLPRSHPHVFTHRICANLRIEVHGRLHGGSCPFCPVHRPICSVVSIGLYANWFIHTHTQHHYFLVTCYAAIIRKHPFCHVWRMHLHVNNVGRKVIYMYGMVTEICVCAVCHK